MIAPALDEDGCAGRGRHQSQGKPSSAAAARPGIQHAIRPSNASLQVRHDVVLLHRIHRRLGTQQRSACR
jgi:hypothetical protein